MTLDFSKTPEEFTYQTDETYQALFQQFFKFKDDMIDIGDVYDVEQVKMGMNYILTKTSDMDEWWKKLFLKAASMFLSEDIELGLCVCLNFSYMDLFYKVFYCLENNPNHVNLKSWKIELEKRVFD